MTILFEWMDGVQEDFYAGTLDWETDDWRVALFTSANGIPDKAGDLLLSDWTGELSHASYSRKVLANKQVATVTGGAVEFQADPAIFTTLATAAGAARYAVVYRSTDSRVMGYYVARNDLDATDLVGAGGNAVFYFGRPADTGGPGTPQVGAATTLAEALGVGFGSPTPTKMTTWESDTTTTLRNFHAFGHTGLATPMTDWIPSVGGMIDSTTGIAAGLRSRVTLKITSPPMQKVAKLTGESQSAAQIRAGQTISNVNGGVNDSYYRSLGAKYHEKGFDVALADGRKNLIQPGQEWNLTSFPWYLGTDPIGAANMFVRMVLLMRAGTTGSVDWTTKTVGNGTATQGTLGAAPNGISASGVEIVFNVNTLGAASRANIIAFLDIAKIVITVFSVDWYDIDTGALYYNDRLNMGTHTADVFSRRAGNIDTTKDTKVGANWILQTAVAYGFKCSIDEWGTTHTLMADTVPTGPAIKDNLGSGVSGAATFVTSMCDWIEDVAIPTGIFLHADYFNYDVPSTGLYHKITPDGAYDSPAAFTVLKTRF